MSDTEAGAPAETEIRAQLARILGSAEFSRTERLRQFLEHVVEGALSGNERGLTEQPIACELYARDGQFDASSNSAVRVDARRLRDRLREYYAAHVDDPVLIGLPKGGYVPSFRRNPGHADAGRKSRITRYVAVGSSVLLAALLLALFFRGPKVRSPETPPARQVTDVLPLTSYVGQELHPSFSPDGSQVVFAWNGTERRDFDLYVKVIGEDRPFRLTRSPDNDLLPAWAPDGRRIAFVRSARGGGGAAFLVSPLGGPERRIAEQVIDVSWAPDSRYVLLTRTGARGDGDSIWTVAIDSGEARRITDPGTVAVDRSPRVSSDGEQLAYVRCATRARQNCDIYLAPWQGDGSAVRLTRVDRPLSGLAWAPDSREIVFSVLGRLERIAASNPGAQDPVPLNLEGAFPAMVERDGRVQLAWQAQRADSSIARIWFEPASDGQADRLGTWETLIDSTRKDLNPVVSPDGATIAFVSDRDGRFATWLSDPAGEEIRLLSAAIDGQLAWSPDGSSLAGLCADAIDDRNDVCIVDVASGFDRRVAPSPHAEGMGTWSADGRDFYFLSTRAGPPTVWKAALRDEAPEQVTEFPAILLGRAWERDELLYFPDPDLSRRNWSQELWALDPASGRRERLLDRVFPFAVAVAPTGLYWLDYSAGEEALPRLRHREWITGAQRSLGQLPVMPWGTYPEISVDPAERYLLVATAGDGHSDLLLVPDWR